LHEVGQSGSGHSQPATLARSKHEKPEIARREREKCHFVIGVMK